jgi:hypothetical protein
VFKIEIKKDIRRDENCGIKLTRELIQQYIFNVELKFKKGRRGLKKIGADD